METLTTTTNSGLNSLTTSEAAFAGGILGTVMIALAVFCVLLIVAQWKIFEKAGEKGWKSLIPIYGQYILFKIVGAKTWFWVFLCISIITSIMTTVNVPAIDWNASQEVINAQLELIDWSQYVPFIIGMGISFIAAIAIDILLSVKLAKAFGKDILYVLGLIFFPEIVLLVLAFGKAKYDKKAVNA